MLTLSQALIDEKNKPANSDPWIWLLRATIDLTTSNHLQTYLTSFTRQVTWNGKTYEPFPYVLSPIQQDADGTLPEMRVSLSNHSREAGQFLALGDGFIGHDATLTLIHWANVGGSDKVLQQDFHVIAAQVNDEAATLSLSLPNLFGERLPADLYVRNRCRWVFKGPECLYNGSLRPNCLKTLLDCTAFGVDEIARNLPKLHPRRFGGFPAIPLSRR